MVADPFREFHAASSDVPATAESPLVDMGSNRPKGVLRLRRRPDDIVEVELEFSGLMMPTSFAQDRRSFFAYLALTPSFETLEVNCRLDAQLSRQMDHLQEAGALRLLEVSWPRLHELLDAAINPVWSGGDFSTSLFPLDVEGEGQWFLGNGRAGLRTPEGELVSDATLLACLSVWGEAFSFEAELPGKLLELAQSMDQVPPPPWIVEMLSSSVDDKNSGVWEWLGISKEYMEWVGEIWEQLERFKVI